LTTLNLKRINVAWVVAKARTLQHGDLLERIGADQVIYPEAEARSRLAHSIAVRHIKDYISLTQNSGVAKVTAPSHFIGHTVAELDTSNYSSLNLLLIKRGRQLLIAPSYEEKIEAGDELLLVGPDSDI